MGEQPFHAAVAFLSNGTVSGDLLLDLPPAHLSAEQTEAVSSGLSRLVKSVREEPSLGFFQAHVHKILHHQTMLVRPVCLQSVWN